MSDRLLRAREIADVLGVSTETVLRWNRRGELPGFRLPSGALRFRSDEFDAWLRARATAPSVNRRSAARNARLSSVRSTVDEE